MKKLALLLFASSLAIGGCGGAGSNSVPSGGASFRIKWPDPSRIIPDAADKVKVTLTSYHTPQVQRTKEVNRPTAPPYETLVSFDPGVPLERLETGRYYVTVDALTNANATVASSAEFDLEIVQGLTASDEIELNSVIDHVDVTLSGTLREGRTVNATATARTVANAAVPVKPESWAWSSSSGSVVFANNTTTAADSATLPIYAVGTGSNITVIGALKPNREVEGSKSGTVSITITNESTSGNIGTQAFGPYGSRAYSGAAAVDVSGLLSGGANAGGYTLALTNSSSNPFVALTEVDANTGPGTIYQNWILGGAGSPEGPKPGDEPNAIGGLVADGTDLFVMDQTYAFAGFPSAPLTSDLQKYVLNAGSYEKSGGTVASPNGPMAMFSSGGSSTIYVYDGASSAIKRFDTSLVASTDVSVAGLLGSVVETTVAAVAATTDGKVYLAGPAGATNDVAVLSVSLGTATSVNLFRPISVAGTITGIAANTTNVFVMSYIGTTFTIGVYDRTTGISVASQTVPADFVPYRICANAAGNVDLLGADVSSAGTYSFEIRRISFAP